MKTLITKLKDPKYYNVYYNHSTNKLQVIKTAYNPFRINMLSYNKRIKKCTF
jgi:hypothetical protein